MKVFESIFLNLVFWLKSLSLLIIFTMIQLWDYDPIDGTNNFINKKTFFFAYLLLHITMGKSILLLKILKTNGEFFHAIKGNNTTPLITKGFLLVTRKSLKTTINGTGFVMSEPKILTNI